MAKQKPKPRVVKGMPSVALDARGVRAALSRALLRPAFADVGDAARRGASMPRGESYSEYRKSPRTRKAGPELRGSRLRAAGRVARGARRDPRAPSEHQRRVAAARASSSSTARRAATSRAPARCRRRTASRRSRSRARGAAASRSTCSTSRGSTSRVRPRDLPVQGVRVDGDAALPLAVLVLPEPRARPDARLDERDLSALGRRARRADRDAGALVPGAVGAEADDRPARVRRRRQPRPDDARTARTRREAKALELAGWDYPKHLAGRAFAVVVHGDAAGVERRAARALRLARLDGARPRRASRGARSLRRLLRAVRDEPRRARSRRSRASRGAQRGAGLLERVRQIRLGRYESPDAGLEAPRKK